MGEIVDADVEFKVLTLESFDLRLKIVFPCLGPGGLSSQPGIVPSRTGWML